jgi:sarcosine oxidase subunit beta
MSGTPARNADAVVIGGGVVGAAAAFELVKAGARTVLLERGAPNRESSGTTAGNIHIQAIHPLRPGQDVPADARRFLPLQRAASRLWDTLEDELDAGIELRRAGGLMVAETPEQAAHLREKWALEAQAGIDSTLLDGDAARTMVPQLSHSVLAATYCAEDGYANPLKVGPAYLCAAQRLGLELECFTEVQAIEHEEGAYLVRASGSSWRAPVVINAAGVWLDRVARMVGIHLQMAPCSLQMQATVRVRPILRHLIQHIGEGLSVKQVQAGNILIGGGWPARPLDLAGRTQASIPSLFGNVALAQRILPFLREVRMLRAWGGPFAPAPDELPVVGEVPGYPGFLVLGGSYAFTLAPLWGRVLCALALGRPPGVDLTGLGPERLLLAAHGHQHEEGA